MNFSSIILLALKVIITLDIQLSFKLCCWASAETLSAKAQQQTVLLLLLY